MIIEKNDEKFSYIIQDIISHPEFIKLKNFKHHTGNIYEHSIDVAYKSYKIALKYNLDYKACARGGALHDFFLYNWRDSSRNILKWTDMHAFQHPLIAYKNANKYFDISDIEKDIIVKHMFPTTIVPPKYIESWIITIVDKQCAMSEYIEPIIYHKQLKQSFSMHL